MPDLTSEKPKKNYLITGSSGIAAATAHLAVSQGARVFIVGKDAKSGQDLMNELRGADGECDFFAADLTDQTQVAESVTACVKRFSRIDALFNVAGISGRSFGDGAIHECTLEGWNATIDNNAKTVFLMCREIIKQMLGQEIAENGLRGTILNMGSILAFSPEPRFFASHAYAASKAAITGMSRAMAAYYAPHKIRVNVIAPSLVETPMSRRAQSDQTIIDYMKLKQPLSEKMVEAEAVAEAAMFLLGDASRRITGDVLNVDAGWNVTSI